MKTKRQRALTALLSAVLAFTLIFSSCNSLVEPNDIDNISSTHEAGLPGVGTSDNDKITEPSKNINDFEEISEAASLDDAQSEEASSEESNGSASEEVSSEVSEMSEEQSAESSDNSEAIKDSEKNKPSTLTPILELGIGDGDYEVGFAKDDYDFDLGPSSFYCRSNEILVCDAMNKRLLLYKNGKLIDKTYFSGIDDISIGLDCIYDDNYYYLLDILGKNAYRIDRKTKTHSAISLDVKANSNQTINRFSFFENGGDIYIVYIDKYSEIVDKKKVTPVYMLVDGEKARKVNYHESYVFENNENVCIIKRGEKQIKLTADKTNDGIYCFRDCLPDRYITYHYELDNSSKVFCSFDASGKMSGRYVQQLMSKPINASDYEKIDKNGNLIVAKMSNMGIGFYMVDFGIDDSFVSSVKKTNLSISYSSTVDIPHPTVTLTAAQAMVDKILNLNWIVNPVNQTKPQ